MHWVLLALGGGIEILASASLNLSDGLTKIGYAGLTLVCFGVAFCGAGESAEKPNVIVIMADDAGAECFGCYGGESYATPHPDALARSGMRFERSASSGPPTAATHTYCPDLETSHPGLP